MLVFPQTLSQYGNLVFEGNVLEIYAGVNSAEDEEPKLLCDRVRAAPKEAVRQGENEELPKRRNSPQRLYLKFPSKNSKECCYAKKLICVFEGTSPVSFYYDDVKQYEHLPHECNVFLNDVMINELKRVLGDGAVVVK